MPDLSVIISSLNGATGVDRALRSLDRQTIADRVEAVVVDDGSSDGTSDVGHEHGARVVRHHTNKGLAAARNSGVRAATAPIVAFIDDDVEAEPDWAERLLAAYGDGVVGVGGLVVPSAPPSVIGRYLERNNPLEPLEAELGESESLPYRFALYLRRQWGNGKPAGRREVYALVGANMSFRREALLAAGGFDPRFTFGAEELDACRRIAAAHPDERFVLEPDARVVHHFEESFKDTIRRSRSYGRGSARMFRKWPSVRPTFFPVPVALAGLLLVAIKRPAALALAALAPPLAFPMAVRRLVASRSPEPLLDPYIMVAQETAENAGFIQGLWQFRDLEA